MEQQQPLIRGTVREWPVSISFGNRFTQIHLKAYGVHVHFSGYLEEAETTRLKNLLRNYGKFIAVEKMSPKISRNDMDESFKSFCVNNSFYITDNVNAFIAYIRELKNSYSEIDKQETRLVDEVVKQETLNLGVEHGVQ